MVGRNDPCPCGSGKKYKKCCLPRDEAGKRKSVAYPPAGNSDHAGDHELASWKEADRQLIRKGMSRIDGARLNASKLLEKYWGMGARERWQREDLSEPGLQQSSGWLWLDWRRSRNSKTFAEQMMSDPSLSEQNFRRIMGYRDLWMLKAALDHKGVLVLQEVG